VLGDLLGSVGAIAAAIIIWLTGWMPIDPILSVLVAAIILRSAWAVVRESGHILLEGAPREFDRREVVQTLGEEVEGVTEVSHVHAWQVTQERPMATLEVVAEAGSDKDAVRREVKRLLKERFGMDHATVEVR